MNYSRNELVKSEATVNQMRNSIYILQRFMKVNGLTEIKQRLKRMGQLKCNHWILKIPKTSFACL